MWRCHLLWIQSSPTKPKLDAKELTCLVDVGAAQEGLKEGWPWVADSRVLSKHGGLAGNAPSVIVLRTRVLCACSQQAMCAPPWGLHCSMHLRHRRAWGSLPQLQQ